MDWINEEEPISFLYNPTEREYGPQGDRAYIGLLPNGLRSMPAIKHLIRRGI